MGIQSLLPNFSSISKKVHIREYRGKRVAVDTYGWLHRGAINCSKELCQGKPTEKYIIYCMHLVRLLQQHGVIPVLVFDGGVLPAKAAEEAKRARSRKEHLAQALAHEKGGNFDAAYKCYRKAVDITPLIAFRLIQVLQKESVEYIVAPYEADAQLAFLARSGNVHAVITEDSDMIPYACPRVLFKMDKFGQGEEIQYSNIARTKDLSFVNFTAEMILEMCILSGCDYLPSLPGMGVKKAHGLIRRFKTYKKVLSMLKFNGVTIPGTYEESFALALLTFQHQRVYDPSKGSLMHLTEPRANLDVPAWLNFVGPDLPPDIARAIARGECDPSTHKPFQVPSLVSLPGILPERQSLLRKEMELPCQRNSIKNYYFATSSAAKREFRAPRPTGNLEEKVMQACEDHSQDIPISTAPTSDLADPSPPEDSRHPMPPQNLNSGSSDFVHFSCEIPDFEPEEPYFSASKRLRLDASKRLRLDAEDETLEMEECTPLAVKRKHFAARSRRLEPGAARVRAMLPPVGDLKRPHTSEPDRRNISGTASSHGVPDRKRPHTSEPSRRNISGTASTHGVPRHTSGPAARQSSCFFHRPSDSENEGGGARNCEQSVPEYVNDKAGPSTRIPDFEPEESYISASKRFHLDAEDEALEINKCTPLAVKQKHFAAPSRSLEPYTARVRAVLPPVGDCKRPYTSEPNRRNISGIAGTHCVYRRTSGSAVRQSSSFFQRPSDWENGGGVARICDQPAPEDANDEGGPSRTRGPVPGMRSQHQERNASGHARLIGVDRSGCDDDNDGLLLLTGNLSSRVSHMTCYKNIGDLAMGRLAELTRYAHSSGDPGATRAQRPVRDRLPSPANTRIAGGSSSRMPQSFEDFAFRR